MLAMNRKIPLTQQAQQFALLLPITLGLAAAALNWGFWFWPQRPRIALALLIAAPMVNTVALLLPRLWINAYRAWMWLAGVLAWISTRLLLITFFSLVLAPIGLIMRILKKRQLDLSFRDDRVTYWIDKPPQSNNIKRYFRQF